MNKFKGFLYGMTASATFGLLPLFTLPTMAEGMTTDSILCYRMLFASLLVAVLMMVRRVNFSVGLRELSWLVLLGFFYYGSATLLFQAYGSMSSGMATTLHFLYPVGVTLIMAVLFKQRPSPFTIIAIILALSGVALLSLRGSGGEDGNASLVGILLVLLSGLSYAIYLVTVNNVRRIREMDNLKLTAIVIGVVVFGETISGTMALGILLIIVAVTIIVLSPLLDKNIAERLRRFAQRPIGRR